MSEAIASCPKSSRVARAFVLLSIVVIVAIWTAYCYEACNRKLVLLTAAAFGFFVLALMALISFFPKVLLLHETRVFGMILGLSALFFVFIFPPFKVPDEYHHYAVSYWLADCVTGKANAFGETDFLDMRADDYDLYVSTNESGNVLSSTSYDAIVRDFSFQLQRSGTERLAGEMLPNLSLGGDNVFAKVGSVAGILIAKALSLGAYPLFYLGRIGSAAFFVLCAVFAVRITPIGKHIFMGIALLPMTLHLAGSYSYDGGIIGISFVFIALCLRARYGEGKLSRSFLIALIVGAILLAPCKFVYSCELLLLLLIPSSRFSSRRASILFKAIVPCVAIGIALSFKFASIVYLTNGVPVESANSPGTTEMTYTLAMGLSDPLSVIALLLRTIIYYGDTYWQWMIGSTLGWLQPTLTMPTYLIVAYLLILIRASQISIDDSRELLFAERLQYAGVFILVVLAVLTTFVFGGTPVSSEVIIGVQGRYFLPALPLALLASRSSSISISARNSGTILASLSILNWMFVIALVSKALVA